MYWIMAMCVIFVLVNMLSSKKSQAVRERLSTQCPDGDYSSIVSAEVRGLLESGHRIQALKQLRLETGLGLKDAREILETIEVQP